MRAAALLPWLLVFASALSANGSLELRLEGRYAEGFFNLEPVYAGSLLAQDSWGSAALEAALFPSWNLASQELDSGVSKLEITFQAPSYALGVGASPEPIAVLRLVQVLSLVSPSTDHAPGLWGGWLEHYAGTFTRYRLAVRRVQGRPLGVLRVDGRSLGLDYQLTALYGPQPAPAALGVGATARLNDWIVYGEGWWLGRSNAWRGGLGLNRYLLDGLLTVEAAYVDGAHLASSYSWAREDWGVEAFAQVDTAGSRLSASTASLNLSRLSDLGDVTLGLTVTHDGVRGTAWFPSLSARVYY